MTGKKPNNHGLSAMVRCGNAKSGASHRPSRIAPACLSSASKGYARSERHQQGPVWPRADDMPSTSVTVPVDNRSISAPAEQTEPKPKRISKRMRQVLTALATKGMTQREAAKQAGMSETYLSAALRKPEIQVFIARKMRETIAIGGLRASARLIELIDAGSEHVSADVSKHALAIAGVKPTSDAQVSVNIDIKAGYVIDLTDEPKRGPEHMRTVNP